jgi:hypothetical protein
MVTKENVQKLLKDLEQKKTEKPKMAGVYEKQIQAIKRKRAKLLAS